MSNACLIILRTLYNSGVDLGESRGECVGYYHFCGRRSSKARSPNLSARSVTKVAVDISTTGFDIL